MKTKGKMQGSERRNVGEEFLLQQQQTHLKHLYTCFSGAFQGYKEALYPSKRLAYAHVSQIYSSLGASFVF